MEVLDLAGVEFDCEAAVHRFFFAVAGGGAGAATVEAVEVPYEGAGLDEAYRSGLALLRVRWKE